jgi:RNA polymerase sigma-70 factor (ECF subfamily)
MQQKSEVPAEASIVARSSVLLLTQQPMDLEQRVIGVYESLRSPVYQYLAATFGDAIDAEDITQETFLRLYVYWSNGKAIAEDRLRSWIFRVAHNLAIDRERNSKFVQELDSEAHLPAILQLPDPGRNPEETLLDQERFNSVQNGLALLSRQERHCLHLRAEGLRYREIAEILGITRSSVAEFLRRAIRKLMREKNAQGI